MPIVDHDGEYRGRGAYRDELGGSKPKEIPFEEKPLDMYGHFGLVDAMGRIAEAPSLPPHEAPVANRWRFKVKYHYSKVFNTALQVREERGVESFGVRDGWLLVKPGLRGFVRNEDFILMHECVHEKQRQLLGFNSLRELVDAFTDGLTHSELGARDWVEKYTMPPFALEPRDAQQIYSLFSTPNERKQVAMGVRDIHCDTIAARNAHKIFMSDEEWRAKVDPVVKFRNQLADEIACNATELEGFGREDILTRLGRADGEKALIRKAARFTGLATGMDNVEADPRLTLAAGRFEQSMRRIYGAGSREYRAFRSLADGYAAYLRNCMHIGEHVRKEQMVQALASPQVSMRSRAADFLGELGGVEVLSPLVARMERERDDNVKWHLMSAVADIGRRNIGSEVGWATVKALYQMDLDSMNSARGDGKARKNVEVTQQVMEALRCVPRQWAEEAIEMITLECGRSGYTEKIATDLAAKYPEEAARTVKSIVDRLRRNWAEMPESKTVRTWYEEKKPKCPREEMIDHVKLSMSIVIGSVKNVCKEVLWQSHPDMCLDIVEGLLTFPVADTRAGVLLAVGDMGFNRPDRALDLLESHLLSSEPIVRDWALNSVAVLGFKRPNRVISILANAVHDRADYYDPPDYHGNISSTAITGLARLWTVAPERITTVITGYAGSKDPLERALVLDALEEILKPSHKERLTTIRRFDEEKVKEEIVTSRSGEVLDMLVGLTKDPVPSVRSAALHILRPLMERMPERCFEALEERHGERNPGILGSVISLTGELAAHDWVRAERAIRDIIAVNPLTKKHTQPLIAVAGALSKVADRSTDCLGLLDLAETLEAEAMKYYSASNYDVAQREVSSLTEPEKTAEGPKARLAWDFEIHRSINDAIMKGGLKPLSGIRIPEDKFGMARVDISRAFIGTISHIGSKTPELADNAMGLLWELFKEREPATKVDTLDGIGEVGKCDPKKALVVLKTAALAKVPVLSERALMAITKFAEKAPQDGMEIVDELIGSSDQEMKSQLAKTLGLAYPADPEKAVRHLSTLLRSSDWSTVHNACDSLKKAATLSQLNGVYNNPDISAEARNLVRDMLADPG
jgi:hypothetical protein